ncbi:MAG TPA: tyrosine--tRNA ligase [Candidatus Dormibacteraeota bacterium]
MQPIDEFARGTEHLEDRAHLAARLARGERLRIKLGVDPTAPDLHLGHTVPLRRLRAWQETGHTAVIIIGDWTARIGDPSGRSETRPPLSAEAVAANAQTYLAQLFLILDRASTEVRWQSEWFATMDLAHVLRLAASRTVQQMLQRNDFSERLRAGRSIGVHELFYPLLQGYDSVAVDADVEIGGTDQLFNLLAARDVQRFYGRAEPQDVVTFPLLEGLDGERKMSKSYDNYIGIAEPPEEQYGKAMSLPDRLIVKYMELVTDLPASEVERYRRALANDDVNPRDAKAALAEAIVRQFHGGAAAQVAAERFQRVHGEGGLPPDMPEVAWPWSGEATGVGLVVDALGEAGIPLSRNEIRRLIEQRGVTLIDTGDGNRAHLLEADAVRLILDGTPSDGPRVVPAAAAGGPWAVRPGVVLRIGKRRFVRLVAQ